MQLRTGNRSNSTRNDEEPEFFDEFLDGAASRPAWRRQEGANFSRNEKGESRFASTAYTHGLEI